MELIFYLLVSFYFFSLQCPLFYISFACLYCYFVNPPLNSSYITTVTNYSTV